MSSLLDALEKVVSTPAPAPASPKREKPEVTPHQLAYRTQTPALYATSDDEFAKWALPLDEYFVSERVARKTLHLTVEDAALCGGVPTEAWLDPEFRAEQAVGGVDLELQDYILRALGRTAEADGLPREYIEAAFTAEIQQVMEIR